MECIFAFWMQISGQPQERKLVDATPQQGRSLSRWHGCDVNGDDEIGDDDEIMDFPQRVNSWALYGTIPVSRKPTTRFGCREVAERTLKGKDLKLSRKTAYKVIGGGDYIQK